MRNQYREVRYARLRRLINRHRVSRRSCLEPDGKEHNLLVRIRPSQLHCVHRRIDDPHVSTLNFGWESEAYYQRWLGSSEDMGPCRSMSGASIDVTSPNKVPPRGMLAFFNALLDQKWVAKFKSHYAAVKLKISETA